MKQLRVNEYSTNEKIVDLAAVLKLWQHINAEAIEIIYPQKVVLWDEAKEGLYLIAFLNPKIQFKNFSVQFMGELNWRIKTLYYLKNPMLYQEQYYQSYLDAKADLEYIYATRIEKFKYAKIDHCPKDLLDYQKKLKFYYATEESRLRLAKKQILLNQQQYELEKQFAYQRPKNFEKLCLKNIQTGKTQYIIQDLTNDYHKQEQKLFLILAYEANNLLLYEVPSKYANPDSFEKFLQDKKGIVYAQKMNIHDFSNRYLGYRFLATEEEYLYAKSLFAVFNAKVKEIKELEKDNANII